VTYSDIGGNVSPSAISPVGVWIENLFILALSAPLFGGFLRIELITGAGRGSLSGSGQIGSGTTAVSGEHRYSQR
jgi:hypothetical protein